MLGDISILVCIRALYAVYIRNIRDAFELGEKLAPPKFHPKVWQKQSLTKGPLERQNTGDFEIEGKKMSSIHSNDDSTLIKNSSDTKSIKEKDFIHTKWGLLEEEKTEGMDDSH